MVALVNHEEGEPSQRARVRTVVGHELRGSREGDARCVKSRATSAGCHGAGQLATAQPAALPVIALLVRQRDRRAEEYHHATRVAQQRRLHHGEGHPSLAEPSPCDQYHVAVVRHRLVEQRLLRGSQRLGGRPGAGGLTRRLGDPEPRCMARCGLLVLTAFVEGGAPRAPLPLGSP